MALKCLRRVSRCKLSSHPAQLSEVMPTLRKKLICSSRSSKRLTASRMASMWSRESSRPPRRASKCGPKMVLACLGRGPTLWCSPSPPWSIEAKFAGGEGLKSREMGVTPVRGDGRHRLIAQGFANGEEERTLSIFECWCSCVVPAEVLVWSKARR